MSTDQNNENDARSSSATVESCAARDVGRLQALKEKFRRCVDRCQEQERYEAMDVWRNAAVDVEKLQETVEEESDPKNAARKHLKYALGELESSYNWELLPDGDRKHLEDAVCACQKGLRESEA